MVNAYEENNIELEKTLEYLFRKISNYETKNPDQGHSLRKILFGVNGEVPIKMRKIGERILSYSGQLSFFGSVTYLDKVFEGNPDLEELILRINCNENYMQHLLRGCSLGFLSPINSQKIPRGINPNKRRREYKFK